MNIYLDKAKKSLYQDAAGVWLDEIGSSMANTSETTNNKRKLDGTQDIQYRFEEVADSAVNDVVIIKEEKVTREEIYGRVPEFHKAPLKPVIADPIFKNPCSFESLIEIFRVVVEKNKKRILQRLGVGPGSATERWPSRKIARK